MEKGMNGKQQSRKIGYARVSTKDQHLDMQLIALEKAGCDKIYRDHGISGKVFPRKGLDKALKALDEGDILVVHKLDRLGRDTLELLKLLKQLEERKVRLHSLTQSIDISTASGKLTLTIFAALAEHERIKS
ncbi:MAG: recombinase family protein [Proteobacteria bacterium]|nr:recombinase family protein [Pseudomonadota bacterium]